MSNWLKQGSLAVIVMVIWILVAGFGAFEGWWMSPVVARGDATGFTAWATRQIDENVAGNAAYVLIADGEVVAEHYTTTARGVNADTLFPAASLSKLPAALAVMVLIERDEIELDAPVSNYLSRWQLPLSAFASSAVTVRQLLSHTGGLNDGLGFGDYTADETVPDLVTSLQAPRAGNGETRSIQLGREPGASFAYSGGGYLILELLVEEVSGMKFAEFVTEALYVPLGMTRSRYDYIGDHQNATASFHPDGTVAPSYRYASNAATGLITTARDLTSLAMYLSGSKAGPLSAGTLRLMRRGEAHLYGASIWGSGVMLYAPNNEDFVFGHDGANEPAINTSVRVNAESRSALVVLINGHPSLATSIGGEWVLWQTGRPDFLSIERALESARLPIGIGVVLILLFFACRGWRQA